jgi:hypothetical protein
MEEVCRCCSTLHISSPCSDCSAGFFSPHSGKSSWQLWKRNEILVGNNGFCKLYFTSHEGLFYGFTSLLQLWYVLCLPFLVLIPNNLFMQIDQTFVFRRPAVFSKPLMFATGFMTFFSVVMVLFKVKDDLSLKFCSIWIMQMIIPLLFALNHDSFLWQLSNKNTPFISLISLLSCCPKKICYLLQDIPDIEGDPIFGIQSFSVQLGQKKVGKRKKMKIARCTPGHSDITF